MLSLPTKNVWAPIYRHRDGEVIGRGALSGLDDLDHANPITILGGKHHAHSQFIGAQEITLIARSAIMPLTDMPRMVIGRLKAFDIALRVKKGELPNHTAWRTDQRRDKVFAIPRIIA